MSDIVYLNGDYLKAEDAKISVMDRGFLFGDAVYEVIPVYYGVSFRISEHLARLEQSMDAIRLSLAMTRFSWQEIINNLIESKVSYIGSDRCILW